MPSNTLQYKDNGIYYNTKKLLTETDNIVLDVADLRSTIGTADGQLDLGTFTGSIISDNSNVKSALQEVETYLDSATFSKWTSNNTNSVVKLTNLSDGTTARTAGTEFAIKDNGNVGVGTSTPNFKLHVHGGTSAVSKIIPAFGNIDLGWYQGIDSSNGKWSLNKAVNGVHNLNVLNILEGGNLGINTTNPTAKLEVNSDTTNTSGLKFTNLTSTSPTSAGQAIGVDTAGNVVTVAVSVTKDTFIATNVVGSWNGLTGKTVLTFTSKAGAKYLITYNTSIFGSAGFAGYVRLDNNGSQISSANFYFNQANVHAQVSSSTILTTPTATTNVLSIKTNASSDNNDYCSITVVEI